MDIAHVAQLVIDDQPAAHRALHISHMRSEQVLRTGINLWWAGVLVVAIMLCLCTRAIAGGTTETISTFNIGPEGGGFISLVADSQNSGTLYAGTSSAGVFKTVDGGASWHFAGLAGRSVDALAIDQNASTLYALSHKVVGSVIDLKIFKSRDGGEIWTPASLGLPSECHQSAALAVDPQHSGSLYVSACGSVFKSTDAGETWSPASNGLQGDLEPRLAIAPQDSNIIYAVTIQCDQSGKRPPPACDSRIFRSVDGAENWSEATLSPLVGDLSGLLVVDPQDNDTLYLHVTWNSGMNGVTKSVDGGRTWSTPTAYSPYRLYGSVYALVIDPRHPNTIYVSSFLGVFKSTDGGQSWTAIYPYFLGLIVVDPQTPGTIFGTGSNGIIKSTDEGANWTVLPSGLRDLWITAAVIDPQSPDTLYAGTYIGDDGTGGLFKSTDKGRTWVPASAGLKFDFYGGNKVVTLAIDPQTSSNLYAGVNGDEGCGGLFKSVDGGMTWSGIGKAYSCPTALVIDSQNPSTVYAATWDGDGVIKSIDGGTTWAPVGFGKSGVTALALDPQNSQTLYAGVLAFAIGTSTLFKSTDGGSTWNSTTLSVPRGTISEVTIDLQNPSTVYVVAAVNGGPGSVWKSVDGGASWVDLSSGLPYGASAVVVDPKNSATIYASTSLGLMMSTDGGGTWVPLASDIIAAQFLLLDPKSDDTLYAGGPSLFEIARSSVTALTFDAAVVKVGASFTSIFVGSNLSEMYFDVQVRPPGSAADIVALNWQAGTTESHSVQAGISIGTWTVDGVRAHQDPEDHTGAFVPVSATITVSP
jgi:photosystem II stability/assembly factor-like uncharacterized protein